MIVRVLCVRVGACAGAFAHACVRACGRACVGCGCVGTGYAHARHILVSGVLDQFSLVCGPAHCGPGFLFGVGQRRVLHKPVFVGDLSDLLGCLNPCLFWIPLVMVCGHLGIFCDLSCISYAPCAPPCLSKVVVLAVSNVHRCLSPVPL